jgi:hypothetical protein
LTTSVKGALRWRGPELWDGENIMMVLLGYFFIAAFAGVAASAMVGLVLTNLLIGRFKSGSANQNFIE